MHAVFLPSHSPPLSHPSRSFTHFAHPPSPFTHKQRETSDLHVTLCPSCQWKSVTRYTNQPTVPHQDAKFSQWASELPHDSCWICSCLASACRKVQSQLDGFAVNMKWIQRVAFIVLHVVLRWSIIVLCHRYVWVANLVKLNCTEPPRVTKVFV